MRPKDAARDLALESAPPQVRPHLPNPVSCEKWGPPKMAIPGPYIPGSMGTRVLIFLGVWGLGIPILQTIFWEFRDPQCDARLSTSITMNTVQLEILAIN